MQMDIASFYLLLDSSDRNTAKDKQEMAWTMMTAAQGTVEGMKKLTEPWKRASGVGPTNDALKLMRDHG